MSKKYINENAKLRAVCIQTDLQAPHSELLKHWDKVFRESYKTIYLSFFLKKTSLMLIIHRQ